MTLYRELPNRYPPPPPKEFSFALPYVHLTELGPNLTQPTPVRITQKNAGNRRVRPKRFRFFEHVPRRMQPPQVYADGPTKPE